MAKKSKKEEPAELVYYAHKTRKSLYVADKFIYEMCVYRCYDVNHFILQECKYTELKEFKEFEITKVIEKDKKKYIQYIELIGAPIDFLKENRFYEDR